ncbi:hypothetical protein [Paenibacillus silvisoli]|uniref:hypothetical protein n=1 Tax=Paenibacillus silvisoli TaxID=3110539 RepID=UPI0028052FE4|nr:hypothetical protein [Paenibacillus silvisoli]
MNRSQQGIESRPSSKARLDNYRFSGFHKSHIGAVKSCLDYFNIACSEQWVHGMTGNAFIAVIDEELAAPNVGEPEEEMFALARHLGLNIEGFHTFAADKETFESLQKEAWDAARTALDRGQPVFAKELDLGNETSVVYAYDEDGYYTYSWHGGDGHEGSNDVIPWTMLGRNYCPCLSCRERARRGEWAQEAISVKAAGEGGYISLHAASPCAPSDDRTALLAALSFALSFSRLGKYEWGGRAFYTGSAAYDRWIAAVRSDAILGFYMGYYADTLYESRRNGYLFLKEASGRFEGELSAALSRASAHYKLVQEKLQALSMMFPWEQPGRPIEDPDRRKEAAELLSDIKRLDGEGEQWLERLSGLCV